MSTLLDRFKSQPVEGFQLRQVKTLRDPILEGYDNLVQMELQSLQLIKEHTLATFYGYEQDSPEIIREGLGDMLASAAQFFKELTMKLVEFMKKSILYLTSVMSNFEKFLEKYKDTLLKVEKKYTVWGYEYNLKQPIPRTDVMAKIVSEFNNEVATLDKMSKGDIVKKREDFVNENSQDKLRAAIAGFTQPIEASDFITEVKKVFRSGQEEQKEIQVDKAVLSRMINDYKETKKILNEARAERSKVEGVYRQLESFFAKGAANKWIEGNRTLVANKTDTTVAGKQAEFKTGEEVKFTATNSNLDVINFYYSFKWKQAQLVGAFSYQVFIERINAIKEALSFYEKTIRRSIFAHPEPKGDDL